MPPKRDLTGQIFSHLTVLGFAPTPAWAAKKAWFRCRCLCGREVRVYGYSLVSGNTTSCGCILRDLRRKNATTHGLCGTAEYRIWRHMVDRCHTPTDQNFADYGGRGITVCDRWRHDVAAFYTDLGPRPEGGMTLERKDTNGNYSPENCVWASRLVQANNRRTTVYLEWNGHRRTLMEWSQVTGLSYHVIRNRRRAQWPVHRILTEPLRYS